MPEAEVVSAVETGSRPWPRRLRWVAVVVAVLALAALTPAFWGEAAVPVTPASVTGEAEPARMEAVTRRLTKLAPRGVWISVDTFNNRLYVWRGTELLREAVCSTGTGRRLVDPDSGRSWVFETPFGEWRVQRKVVDPVWVKPDWAFIEEGVPVPDDWRERYDDVSLGDYGLYLGDGYIIHGTLFASLLGKPMTHGCIRLGDEDLEYVYRQVPLGARVLLY